MVCDDPLVSEEQMIHSLTPIVHDVLTTKAFFLDHIITSGEMKTMLKYPKALSLFV